MTDNQTESPVRLVVRLIKGAWNTMLTVYYANTISWRLLKSGALLFFGFFLWAGSSVILSYIPDLTALRFVRSYGFVLILYGPFHHLVIIPVYQRLRRQGTNLSFGSHLHLPNISLAIFLILVITFGIFPVGPMTIDFRSSLESSAPDVAPDLACVKNSPSEGPVTVHCHLSESQGVDKVVVTSSGETLHVDEEPPFEFTVRADELHSVTGSKRFTVDLLAEDGTLVRRYTRTLSMIEEG